MDASTVDTSAVDANTADAYVVDARAGDIVANYEAADLVLGQESYSTKDANHGGVSARSLNYPTSVAVDSTGSIWAYDVNNARVLGWGVPPVTNFDASSLVVGRSDFVTIIPNVPISASTFGQDSGLGQIGVGGGKLLVPSNANNRVLVFNPTPSMSGPNATIVLGQPDFTTKKTGAGATDLFIPFGAWTDGSRVVVSDSGNNRVLIWTSFPTVSNQAANIVIGQADFGISSKPAIPTASSMKTPMGVFCDGTRLYVADNGNHRVLVWNTFPVTNGQPADFVLGQASFSDGANGPASSTRMFAPKGIAVANNSLFVADTGNNRILVYSPIPTTSGAAATFVLGQPDFTSNASGVSQNALSQPEFIAIQGHELYVPDTSNNRIVRFGLNF